MLPHILYVCRDTVYVYKIILGILIQYWNAQCNEVNMSSTNPESHLVALDDLNKSQSKLPLFGLLFSLYLILGIAYFTGAHDFTVLNSLYFSVITYTTVGYAIYFIYLCLVLLIVLKVWRCLTAYSGSSDVHMFFHSSRSGHNWLPLCRDQ
jgi:hypothetical protein